MASAVPVATRPPIVAPPSALNWPVIVEEPVTARLVVVPEVRLNDWPVMRPVFEMLKSVEVAKDAVEDAITKSVLVVEAKVDEETKIAS